MLMSGFLLLPRATSGSQVLLQSGSVLMSMTHTTTKVPADVCVLSWIHVDNSVDSAAASSHIDMGGLCCLLRPWWSRFLLLLRSMTGSKVLLQLWSMLKSVVLFNHQRPCGCSWSVLQPKVMLMFEVWDASKGLSRVHGPTWAQGFICGLWYHQKWWRSPWPEPQLTIMSKEASLALILMTTDVQLRKRDVEAYVIIHTPTHLPQKCNSLKRKPSES